MDIQASIKTSKGTINLNFFADEAPVTTVNFVNLSEKGFYDNLIFHRVIDDFMVQGGCPDGNGRGGPGYKFADEIVPELKHDQPGTLSMANAGPNTNGSQFFITHIETPWLNGKHTVFGRVIDDSDMDVVNKIEQGDTIETITVSGDTEELKGNASKMLEYFNSKLEI